MLWKMYLLSNMHVLGTYHMFAFSFLKQHWNIGLLGLDVAISRNMMRVQPPKLSFEL